MAEVKGGEVKKKLFLATNGADYWIHDHAGRTVEAEEARRMWKADSIYDCNEAMVELAACDFDLGIYVDYQKAKRVKV